MSSIEKIDGVILKYAFSGRRYMLDLVNRGIRSEYFAPGADKIFRILFELFTDSSIASVVSQEVFIAHCNKIVQHETATLAASLFERMRGLECREQDYTYHLKVFRDRHNMRVARENLDRLQKGFESGLDTGDINELFHQSWNKIASLNRIEVFDEGTIGVDIANMKAEYEAVEKDTHGYRGVTVGLPSLDGITNGFQPSELIIVAGMEGTGKSLLMMNMGVNAWLGTNGLGKQYLPTGKNILYFTLEMPRSNRGRFGTAGYLNRRILSCVTELPFSLLRKAALSPTDRKRLMDTMDWIAEYERNHHFYVVDIPRGATVEDIEIKYQEVREKYPVDLVIVDYMGIMASKVVGRGEDSDWQAQGHIAAGLHEFARSYGVPVVTGAQLNRPQGKNHSLKDQNYNNTRVSRSAMITQNANVVMQIGCRDQEENYLDMPLYLTKMRDGTKGVITLNKAFDRMRVYDGPPEKSSELSQFEDLGAEKTEHEPPVSLDDLELSTSGRLDFGDGDDGTDYSEADF